MKIVAHILVFYFGVLMVQPFVNMRLNLSNKPNSCHPQEMCCKEKMKHQGQKQQNSTTCNRDFCNPFVPCGVSLVYNLPVHRFENKAIESAQKLIPAVNDSIVSDYLSDCWHPPKLS
ncbi:MAG: hypothetical protein JSU01_14700 [Bacteroidetes bacterium]|nr:hypothetical protein [Bacteroidota bacterium]